MSRKSEDAMGILICGLNGTGKALWGEFWLTGWDMSS